MADDSIEHLNFVAQCRGRQHHDNADAAQEQAIRSLGREIGQEKTYNKRADKLLRQRGYR